MTIKKAQAGFNKLIEENNFTIAGHTSDTCNPIYRRVWKRTVQVAWQGEMEGILEIRIMLSGIYPLMTVKRNGKVQGFIWTTPARNGHLTPSERSSAGQDLRCKHIANTAERRCKR